MMPNWIKSLFGAIAGVCLVLLGRGVLSNRGSQDDNPDPDAVGRAGDRVRERAAQARRQRELADDEAIHEVGSRPNTDDPVRDLEARLGSTRPHRDGDGPDKPAA